MAPARLFAKATGNGSRGHNRKENPCLTTNPHTACSFAGSTARTSKDVTHSDAAPRSGLYGQERAKARSSDWTLCRWS